LPDILSKIEGVKTLNSLKHKLKVIEDQNRREDEDLAWNNSFVKNLVIASLIYIFLWFSLSLNRFPHSWLAALVPALGYLLINRLLNFVQRFWYWNNYKK